MGTETIPDRKSTQVIQKSWVNNFIDVLSGDFIGRYLNGIVRANYGRLGNNVYPFKRMFLSCGYFSVGDVIPVFDYGGTFTVPQGWMLCDGSIVGQTAYDAQHSAGDWATYVGSSTLSGKYIPNFDDCHVFGGQVNQTGAAPITTVGSNTQNLAHSHGSPIVSNVPVNNEAGDHSAAPTTNDGIGASTTHVHSFSLTTEFSATQNLEPEYILTRFLIRVI